MAIEVDARLNPIGGLRNNGEDVTERIEIPRRDGPAIDRFERGQRPSAPNTSLFPRGLFAPRIGRLPND